MQNNTKSSVVAGILGVFLGAFGGHDWYLGNTKKAITHVSLCVGGVILLMIGLILTNLSRTIPALNVLFICLLIAAYIIIVGNGIWGFIEGIVIIAQGDAGLAAKGYQVAAPATSFMPAPNANPNEANSTEKPVLTAAPVKAEQATTNMTVTPPEAPAQQPAAEANDNKSTISTAEAGSTTDTAKTPSSAPTDEANSAQASAAAMDTTPEPGTPVSAPNTILNDPVSTKVQSTPTVTDSKTTAPENVAGVAADTESAAAKDPAATANTTTPTANAPLAPATTPATTTPATENSASNATDPETTTDALTASATAPTAATSITSPTTNNTDATIGASTNAATAPAPTSVDTTNPAGQSATSTPPANLAV